MKVALNTFRRRFPPRESRVCYFPRWRAAPQANPVRTSTNGLIAIHPASSRAMRRNIAGLHRDTAADKAASPAWAVSGTYWSSPLRRGENEIVHHSGERPVPCAAGTLTFCAAATDRHALQKRRHHCVVAVVLQGGLYVVDGRHAWIRVGRIRPVSASTPRPDHPSRAARQYAARPMARK